MSKHTPGPWTVETNAVGGFNIKARLSDESPGSKFQAVLCTRTNWPHRASESLANAHLIAAAPDLLEALKWLREPSEHRPDKFNTSQSPGHWHNVPGIWDNDNGDLSGKPCLWCAKWEAARAAIAKAQGK